MNIRETYVFQNQINHFHEYHAPKLYQDTAGHIVRQPKSNQKRKTFVNHIQKVSKAIPGVGAYSINPQKRSSKRLHKIDFEKLNKKPKHTYVDDLVKDKKKIPSVGKYDIVIDHSEEIRKTYQKLGDIERKKAPLFRPTIAEAVNVDNIKVGPNQYNVLQPLGYKSVRGSFSPQHQSGSSNQLPSAFDYQPIPVEYETFSRRQSMSNLSKGKKKSTFGDKGKFATTKRSPGPKYSLISDWVPRINKDGETIGHNYFRSSTSLKTPGIYH